MKITSTGFSSAAVFILVGATSSHVLAFDTSDEYADLYWHNTNTSQNIIWVMNQTNRAPDQPSQATILQFTGPVDPWHMVAVADFDRDGVSDLLWRDEMTGNNAIWLMNLDGTRKAAQTITPGNTNWSVVGVYDANNDGSPDIWWRHKTMDENAIWYMNNTNFITAETFSIPTGFLWKASAIGDCNNDGYGDIIWRELSGSGRVSIWFMRGTNLINAVVVENATAVDQTYKLIGAGQLNRLGNTDFVWQQNGSNNVCWLMASNHFYTSSTTIPSSTSPNLELGGIGGYNDHAHEMLLMAMPDLASAEIVLNWRYGVEKPDVYRRNAGTTSWGSPIVTNSLARRLTNSVTVGQRYEYKVGERFLYSAISAPPIHNRGKVILVVDQTKTNSIEPDLLILRTNLVGDGWTVIRTNVPAHDDVTWSNNVSRIASIKSFILGQYNADPANTKAVFLIGHVPIPYSGFAVSDGHTNNHIGAWTADGYYGSTNATVVNGNISMNWTDQKTNFYSTAFPETKNIAGDGVWDNDFFPTNAAGIRMQMAVSRVDFAKLPAFDPSQPETVLLSRYLQKDNKYRTKQISFPARVVVGGYFGNVLEDPFAYRNALENGSRWFGVNPGAVVSGDFFLEPNTFFCGVLSGNGHWHFITGAGTLHPLPQHWTEDLTLTNNEPKGAFYMLHGSYFADFNLNTNNIYRATLATANYGLVAVANSDRFAQPQWKFEQTGLDEPFGAGIVRTINEASSMQAHRWLGMQGDPTLRANVLSPPSNLTTNGVSNAVLLWNASSEASQYYVYRSTNSLDGPFLVQTGPIGETTWTDPDPKPGVAKIYMVRATKLTVTGSGSFNSLSQGTLLNVN